MRHNEEVLTHLWHKLRKRNAWIFIIHDLIGLDKDGASFLAKLDDGLRDACKRVKRTKIDPRDFTTDEDWIRERRHEYLKAEVKRKGQVLDKLERELEFMGERDAPLFEKLMLRAEVQPVKGQLRRLVNEISAVLSDSELPVWKIEKARAVPLEELVEHQLKHRRINCPIHQGTDRNMLVKDGFGYCFVCNKSLDAIGFLMLTESKTFKDAVNELSN